MLFVVVLIVDVCRLLLFDFRRCVLFVVTCLLFMLLADVRCLMRLCVVCCVLIAVAFLVFLFGLLHAEVAVAWCCCNVL